MKRRTGFVLFSAVLLGAITFLYKESLLQAAGDNLIIEDDLQPVDVIHVIAGDDYRTDYAIQLYKQGYAKYLFFTGGFCKYHGYYHGVHGKQRALDQGVPADAIAFDEGSVSSTYSETLFLKTWLDKQKLSTPSVMVVSDPYHMRRARWTNQRVLGNKVRIVMEPVPFDQTPYQLKWWLELASKQYVTDEYKKLVYYFFRYQLAFGKLQEWLASFDTE